MSENESLRRHRFAELVAVASVRFGVELRAACEIAGVNATDDDISDAVDRAVAPLLDKGLNVEDEKDPDATRDAAIDATLGVL